MKSTLNQQRTTKILAVGLFWICCLFSACYHNLKEVTVSSTKVPIPLAAKWSAGKFPMHKFWEYDGTYAGQAANLGIAFDIKPDGNCEFYQVTAQNVYGCRTQHLIYKKGTVAFHANQSFTFYPSQGTNREFVKVCDTAYQNKDQKVTGEDLSPQTFYYTYQPNQQGQNQLVIRGHVPVIAATTLQASNW
ncbi:hypothetical protein [Adhaeribacter pallidiroseus]|uniref:Lipoprotein n=1 Tax=Adhaeribacter pallidiroseus TaxID=2072847 RepID=A0A369QHG0_9BACT|nr:hypothetical protein [Adhaeribacter pallidiroseus]RDC62707.1 hypothetical protein AHMF7616_01301 [Adhaeribacter pallidiroseus]